MSLEYLFCAFGIYVCFLTWGYLQERVSTTPYYSNLSTTLNSTSQEQPPQVLGPHYFKSFIVLNLIQSFTAILVGSFYLFLTKPKKKSLSSPSSSSSSSSSSLKQLSFKQLFLSRPFLSLALFAALTNALASPFGYASLQHIDYPTLILGKSCKLIPVMLLSTVVYRKSFPKYQYLSVFLVTLGVTFFMLFHDKKATSSSSKSISTSKSNSSSIPTQSSLYGLFLLSLNLILDGFTNTSQERLFKKFSTQLTGPHMMVTMNVFGGLFMFMYLCTPFASQEWSAVQFIQLHPTILSDLLLFALCGAMGQVFIFHTLQRFGSVSLVTLTVTRKMMSILLSVVLYHHSLNVLQWLAVVLVFLGIALESYGKSWSSSSSSLSSKVHDIPLHLQKNEKKKWIPFTVTTTTTKKQPMNTSNISSPPSTPPPFPISSSLNAYPTQSHAMATSTSFSLPTTTTTLTSTSTNVKVFQMTHPNTIKSTSLQPHTPRRSSRLKAKATKKLD